MIRKSMEDIRRKHVILLFVAQALTSLGTVLSMIVLAHTLQTQEFATYRQSILLIDIVVPFLSLGLGPSITYFLSTQKTGSKSLVVLAITTLALLGVAYWVIIQLAGEKWFSQLFNNSELERTLDTCSFLPIFLLPASLFAPVLIVYKRTAIIAIHSIATMVTLTVSLLIISHWWHSAYASSLARSVVLTISSLIAIVFTLRELPKEKIYFDIERFKKLLSFGAPLMLASGCGTLSLQIDKAIVSSLCSVEEFAVYAIGAMEIPLIGLLTGVMMAVAMPELRRLVNDGDNTGAVMLFSSIASKTSLVLFPTATYLFVCADDFIELLYSSTYVNSATPFRLYLLLVPLRTVVFGVMLTALGENRAVLSRSVVGLLTNLLLTIILVPIIGSTGAIVATILSAYFVEGLWSIKAIAKATGTKFREVMPFLHLFKLLAISIIAALSILPLHQSLISSLSPVPTLALTALVFICILIVVCQILGFDAYRKEIGKICQNVI